MGLLTVHKDNFFSVVENLEDDLTNKYPGVFDNGLGKLPGKVHLQVDSVCQPVILPARKVPVSVKEKSKAELERLQDLKVIAPVDQPTEWVSQFVVAVKKSGDLRICIDPNTESQGNHRNAATRKTWGCVTFEWYGKLPQLFPAKPIWRNEAATRPYPCVGPTRKSVLGVK